MNNKKTHYLGNPKVKKDGVQHNYTKDEVNEYVKCLADPIYFVKNYVYIIHPDNGLVKFDLYPYQETMYKNFNENRFNIILSCRQSGKTAGAVGYLLWRACFHESETIAVLANKGATAREILSRIQRGLENLPFFLQPGCKELNKGSIKFSNETSIFAASTSSSSIRGFSATLLYMDEFAFVENAEQFYKSTYPTISAGKKTKIIITSTPANIGNMFHKLWEGAVQGVNDFVPFEVNWWDVPGRGEKFKAETIANTSEQQFAQEYENCFIGSSDTLLSTKTLLKLKSREPYRKDNRNVNHYFEKSDNKDYIMTVDVSKGRGQDYSTLTVIEINDGSFEQIATFRDNIISPLLLPSIIVSTAKYYNDALVLIENNDVGCIVCNTVYYEYEYDNMFVSSSLKSSGLGVMMTKKVKHVGCSNLKDLIENHKLKIYDYNTIIELSSFCAKGSSFEAANGNHDDLVMNLVLFSWFVNSELFTDISNLDIKNMMYEEKMRNIENDLPPVGILNTQKEQNKLLPGGWQEVSN